MQLKQWTVSLALGLTNALACGSSTDDPPAEPRGTGGSPGTSPPNMTKTRVDWDDASATGIAPSQAFAALQGSCKATLQWATNEDFVEPVSGTSEVAVTVAFDQGSAQVVQCPGTSIGCGKYLSASAHVSIASADGVFDDEGDSSVNYSSSGDSYASFRVPAAEIGGSLKLTAKEGDDASLTYTVLSVAGACQGRVEVGVSGPSGEAGGFSGSIGRFGSWSNNGCEAGTAPLELTAPFQPGLSLKDAIADALRAKVYAGEWDDGTAAQLSLAVSGVPDVACRETSSFGPAILVPVQLTYSTDDGRVPVATIPASLRVTDGGAGQKGLQLIASHEGECSSSQSSLPYTPARCDAGVGRVQLDILVNDNLGSSTNEPAGVSLTVYEYAAGNTSETSADAVHTFGSSSR